MFPLFLFGFSGLCQINIAVIANRVLDRTVGHSCRKFCMTRTCPAGIETSFFNSALTPEAFVPVHQFPTLPLILCPHP